MREMLSRVLHLAGVAAFLVTPMAIAQEEPEDTQTTPDSMEEIVVIGNKDGDPIDLEAHYESQLRERIVNEYLRLQALEDEEQWRETLPEAIEGPGRIKWGYDAQAEARMRRDMSLTDLPIDDVKPATVISISF